MKSKTIHLCGFVCFLVLFINLFLGCAETPVSPSPAKEPEEVKQESSGEVILIVNGDDVGITRVFTDSTLDALFAGKISSASIVPGGYDADRAIAIIQKHPEVEIGIHLSLAGDWKPLAPRETAPSLYNKNGTMWNSDGEARENVKPEHAKLEWEAQIRKIKDAGIKISHMDSHMGSYFLSKEFFNAAFELSRKYKIPLMAAYNPKMPAERKDYFPITRYTGIYNIPGKKESLENRTEAYFAMFRKFKPGVYYIFTHQGVLPEGQKPHGDLNLRINEYKFWTSEETSQKLKEMGISVKPFSALKDVFRKFL